MQSHLAIRRNRKALLSDLSTFVKVTKGLESCLKSVCDDQEIEIDLNEMIMKAFKLVTRAVKFMDVWEDHMQSLEAAAAQAQVPPTPPADRTEFGHIQGPLDHFAPTSPRNAAPSPAANDARDADRQSSSARRRYSRSSQSYVRPGSSNSCRISYRPMSTHGARDSATHRLSCNIHPGSQNLASEKLTVLHNNFLTLLGYFIGLHLQSRSSSELLLTTKQSVLACKDMLELVTDIWERDWKRSHVLEIARNNMYKKITDLAEAAYNIFRPLRAAAEDDIVLEGEGRPLMDAATACVRAAGESVSESRVVIERIGDFTFEPFGLGISDMEAASPSSPPDAPIQPVGAEQSPVGMASSPPPQPLNDPPPPPLITSDEPMRSDSIVDAISASTDGPLATVSEEVVPSLEADDVPLPPLPSFASDEISVSQEEEPKSAQQPPSAALGPDGETTRTDSFGVSSAGESSTYLGSARDSESSAVSQSSTRATSPETTLIGTPAQSSFTSDTSVSHRSTTDHEDPELNVLERTFAHELVFNKEGHVTGGTLPALIERLTTPDATPDASFVSTFFLTFRLFASPTAFAQALIDRFQYVGESPRVAAPVRLRVYNVFKGWLESHWRIDCDKPALDIIVPFATRQLQIVLPTAGKQLARLAEQVATANGPLVPRLISSIGKTNTSIAQYIAPDTPLPSLIINKSQLAALANWKYSGKDLNIMDFDPMELARQFTLKESQIFCSILPEELLASEWTKKSASMAVNVRAMSRLSTDLANLVADSILQGEDAKKRATTIKQWIKIANKFLELANYHSLMAIVCSLTQSTIGRMKRTWDLVSNKTKAKLENLKSVVNHDRNYAALRQRLQNHVPPCVPFVGLYLTDLTFVDAGNQTTRQLPGSSPSQKGKSVINFDKHMKTAKIISDLQRFQIPYRFQEIPELQTWIQDQLVRVRTNDQSDVVKDYYRRSLLLEPRELPSSLKPSPTEPQVPGKDKFELFTSLGWSHSSREKLAISPS